jgi:hypothetical protein
MTTWERRDCRNGCGYLGIYDGGFKVNEYSDGVLKLGDEATDLAVSLLPVLDGRTDKTVAQNSPSWSPTPPSPPAPPTLSTGSTQGRATAGGEELRQETNILRHTQPMHQQPEGLLWPESARKIRTRAARIYCAPNPAPKGPGLGVARSTNGGAQTRTETSSSRPCVSSVEHGWCTLGGCSTTQSRPR